MTVQRDIDLVNDLVSTGPETEWIEFKLNNSNPKMIGELISAISNAACMQDESHGYVIWGVENDTLAIVGTTFNPHAGKVGNQELPLWLAQKLRPSVSFKFRSINHPNGSLVLLEIPAASSAPVAFDGHARIRIGSATPKLVDYPDRHNALIAALRPYAWELGIARQYASEDEVLDLLDFSQ